MKCKNNKAQKIINFNNFFYIGKIYAMKITVILLLRKILLIMLIGNYFRLKIMVKYKKNVTSIICTKIRTEEKY